MELRKGLDFRCPRCNEGQEVMSWGTEYNDPMGGSFLVKCSSCRHHFTLWVDIQVLFNPIPIGELHKTCCIPPHFSF